MKGITVLLHETMESGKDGFNNPAYIETLTAVSNVLVAPVTAEDIRTNTDLSEKNVSYVLAIPKGDTHDWVNKTVEFYGHKWITVGEPLEGIESLIPLSWNRKVYVRYYG